MNNLDSQLKILYKKILSDGTLKADRTNVGTQSIFGYQMRFDLRDGFPLTTLRKIHIKSLIHELLWFLGSYDKKYTKFGNTNIRYLLENGVNFWTNWVYKDYKEQKFKKWQENDLRNSKEVKQFKCLSIKDFTKKIILDDEFALKYGDLGAVYGKQWTDWGGYDEMVEKQLIHKETKSGKYIIDKFGYKQVHISGLNQINQAIEQLIENPDSRRIIVSAWNANEIEDAKLPPCHILYQFYTTIIPLDKRIDYCNETINNNDIIKYMNKHNISSWEEIDGNIISQVKILDHFNIPERYIDLQLYQRSQDVYLGQPFNIASYSLLLTMIAQVVNMIPRDFIQSIGDTHLYTNSIDATKQLLEREIRDLPKLKVNPNIQQITKFRYEDFEIIDYNPHPNIKVDVAV